ncbi:hypothetical protein [Syntrophorhabdus aromaticivorans]|uniref:hypothetical protein n=1 Tax=Syntrophorhabdus aromaticivorans TaxID=328301 RepID=UPI0003FA6E96|nr:hypothetical protein [Syntrophorhabdus aromaticivorans]
MVIVDQLSSVGQLLLNAAKSKSVVSFKSFHALFDDGTSNNDKYDTLEAASRALCPSYVAIYSAIMAKNSDGCPGIGFYDIFNNLRSKEFIYVAGHNDPQQLTVDDKRKIASLERTRVYKHAKGNF